MAELKKPACLLSAERAAGVCNVMLHATLAGESGIRVAGNGTLVLVENVLALCRIFPSALSRAPLPVHCHVKELDRQPSQNEAVWPSLAGKFRRRWAFGFCRARCSFVCGGLPHWRAETASSAVIGAV
jgi:hypothetical protein